VDSGTTFNGSSNNDTFNATNLTFGASDVLVGGAGTDTLNIVITGAAAFDAPAALSSGIENIAVRNVSGAALVPAVTGVTAVNETQTVTLTGEATASAVINFMGIATAALTAKDTVTTVAAAIVTAKANIIAGAAAQSVGLTDISNAAGVLTLTFGGTNGKGDIAPIAASAVSNGTTFTAGVQVIQGVTGVVAVAEVAATAPTTTVVATNFTDATSFTSDASSSLVNFTGLTAAQSAIKSAGAGGMGAGFGTTVTAGTVNIAGGSTAGAVTITGGALLTQTINSTGAANTIGTLTGAATATSTTINATTNLTTGAATNLGATVTVNGAGNVSFGSTGIQTGVTNLNAAGLTGNLTAVLSSLVTANVTGGSGNDVITLGSVLVTGAMVNAGAGSADRLVVTGSTQITTATAPFIKGFEVVQANTGTIVDVTQLAAFNTITGVRVSDSAGGTVAVNGLSATQAANVAIIAANDATGAITLGLTGATTGGQIDTVNATLTTTTAATAAAAAAAQVINLTAIVLTGVEKLVLTGNNTVVSTTGAVTLTTSAALSLDSITLTNAGTNSIVISANQTATNLNVDAAASIGDTTIDAALYAVATGASLKGGSGNDIIIGSALGDNITGGAGNDVLGGTAITGQTVGTSLAVGTIATSVAASTAADTFTGGAGLDVFGIGIGAIGTMSTITDLNLGTAVVAGSVDRIVTDGTAATATVVTFTAAQQATISAAATFAGALDAAIAAFGAVAAVASTFTYGADTFFVLNDVAATTTFTATDLVVKITGVTGTLDASDITLL